MPLNPVSEKIQYILTQINELAPDTQNVLMKQLQYFQIKLHHEPLNPEETIILDGTFNEAKQLIKHLELARVAAQHATDRLTATNDVGSPGDGYSLEKTRKKLNETDLLQTFNTLKKRRDELSTEFEQTTYRKGTGMNIAAWYRHATDIKNWRKVLGNCTEHINVSFVYLYTLVREAASEHNPSPIDCVYRIDVDNDIGGHSYLLLGGVAPSTIHVNKLYRADNFLDTARNFGNACVVVDPWNKRHPFYPASDIPEKMPNCGLIGTVNIEFGLVFRASEENTLSI